LDILLECHREFRNEGLWNRNGKHSDLESIILKCREFQREFFERESSFVRFGGNRPGEIEHSSYERDNQVVQSVSNSIQGFADDVDRFSDSALKFVHCVE